MKRPLDHIGYWRCTKCSWFGQKPELLEKFYMNYIDSWCPSCGRNAVCSVCVTEQDGEISAEKSESIHKIAQREYADRLYEDKPRDAACSDPDCSYRAEVMFGHTDLEVEYEDGTTLIAPGKTLAEQLRVERDAHAARADSYELKNRELVRSRDKVHRDRQRLAADKHRLLNLLWEIRGIADTDFGSPGEMAIGDRIDAFLVDTQHVPAPRDWRGGGLSNALGDTEHE